MIEQADREADPFDRAAQLQRIDIERGRTMKRPEGPTADGSCHWCGAEVGPLRRWCDADCRDNWQRGEK